MARNSLLAVGTGRYVEADDELPDVRDAVRLVRECFESFGYESRTVLDPTYEALRASLSAFLADPAWTPDDAAVLYITGHGVPSGAGHYLMARNTAIDKLAETGVRTDFIAECLGNAPQLAHLLVIIDACYAGLAGTDTATLIARMASQWPTAGAEGRQYRVLGSARDREEAYPLAFPRALLDTVDHLRSSFGSSVPYIGVEAVLEGVNRRMARAGAGHRAVVSAVGVEGGGRFFANPCYLPEGAASARRAGDDGVILQAGELRAHWSPRARGVESAAQQGSFFTGRTAALKCIARWLDASDQPSLLVVTGGPGSGKSAVVARTVLTADASLRSHAGVQGNDEPRPPQGSVRVAVHARGRTVADLRTILEPACVGQDHPVAVVDAVDEATDPLNTVSDLLIPLATSGTRVIVGARRSIARLLRGAVVIDLDDAIYGDPGGLRHFIERVLSHTARSPYIGRDDLAQSVAATLADRAGSSFLLARVAATTLARARAPLAPAQVREASRSWGSLASAFDSEMARFGDDAGRLRDLLTPLAWAQGSGLPWEGIWAAVAAALLGGLPISDVDVAWLLAKAGDLVVEDVEAGRSVYRLFHEELAGYLRRGEPRVANSRIVDALRESVATGPDHQPDWAGAHPYVCRHLATHASAAGRLSELLHEPGYVVAAAPEQLFAAVSAARGPVPDPVQETVLRAMETLRDPAVTGRMSYLKLAAMIEGEPTLRNGEGRDNEWSPRWVHWSTTPPGTLLRALGSPIRGLALAEGRDEPVLLACTRRGDVHAMNPLSGAYLWSTQLGEGVAAAAIANDGACLVLALDNGDVIGFGIDGDELWRFRDQPEIVSAVATGTASGGQVVVTGTYNEGLGDDTRDQRYRGETEMHGVLRLWTVSDQPILQWERACFGTGVRSLHVLDTSAGARVLAAGDPYGEALDHAKAVRLLDLVDGHATAEMPENESAIMAAAIPLGHDEVIASTLRELVRWNHVRGEARHVLKPGFSRGAYRLLALRHRRRVLVILPGYDQIYMLDGDNFTPLIGEGSNTEVATELAGRNGDDGALLISGNESGEIRSWNVDALLSGLTTSRAGIGSATVDESANIVAATITDGTGAVESRDLGSGRLVRRLEGLWARCVASAPASGLIVLACNEDIEARRIRDLEPVWRARVHEAQVNDLRVAGRVVVSAGADGAVRCTALATGEQLCPPARVAGWRDKWFTAVELVGRDPVRVLAGGLSYGVVGWDLGSLLDGVPDPFDQENDAENTVRVRASENIAALGRVDIGGGELLACLESGSPRIRLVDPTQRRELSWTAHDHPVLAFAARGELMWSGDARGVIRSWRIMDIDQSLSPPEPITEVRLGASIKSLHPVGDNAVVVATAKGLLGIDLYQHDTISLPTTPGARR